MNDPQDKVSCNTIEQIIVDEASGVSAEIVERIKATTTPNERNVTMPEVSNTKDTNPKDAIGSQKPNYTNVPVPVLYEIGAAMVEGACKYAAYNYRVAGVRTSVYIGATRRHIDAYFEGEDVDLASGLSHLSKAIASLVVLRDAEMNGMVKNDDRPPCAAEGWMGRAQDDITQVLERHPNPKTPYTQAEVRHKKTTPVSIYAGQTLGYEIEVMLPAPDAPEGFVWAQQGPRRLDLDHTLAVVQSLREDGYGERVIRVTRVADRMEQMDDSTEWVAGEFREITTTVFPGDASLLEATEEEAEGLAELEAEEEVEDQSLREVMEAALDCPEYQGVGWFSSERSDGGPCAECQEDPCEDTLHGDDFDIGGEG